MKNKLSRRDFLKGIGGLTAIVTMAAIVPARAKSAHIVYSTPTPARPANWILGKERSDGMTRAWVRHMRAVNAQGVESFASYQDGSGVYLDPTWRDAFTHPVKGQPPIAIRSLSDAGSRKLIG